MTNANEQNSNLDLQYRTLLLIWSALLLSVVTYFALTFALPRAEAPENRLLAVVLTAASTFVVLLSFFVKKKYRSRATDSQNVGLLRVGLIIAFALCEAGAIFGLIDFMVAHDRYYVVLMMLSFVGMLLHFPKRRDLEAASFKNPGI